MIRALIVLALVLAPGWQVVKGKRFDVFAWKMSEAAKLAPAAEETAKRFEELLGSFPGDRAAVVVRTPDDPEGAPEPAWKEAGASWAFTETIGRVVFRWHKGKEDGKREESISLDLFRRDLALHTLVTWSDREAPDPPRGDGSGTWLPDWWEDAVAGWHGSENSRDMHRDQFQAIRSLGKALPLEDMLDLVRDRDPGWGKDTADPDSLRRIRDALPPELRKELEGLDPDVFKVPVLPAQAFSLLEYLVEDEGLPFVRHLARVLAGGHGMKNALPWLKKNPKERKHPKSLAPGTVRELEIAWKAWLDARGR